MELSDSYFSILKPSEGIFKDKGSKFLAYVFPVKSELDIKTCLTELRQKHPSAQHQCYAWQLGSGYEYSRANDDGEPSSSAGKPILNQIQLRKLTNVLVVVVRYFGGSLLGFGGLIHAYKQAASNALEANKIEEHFIMNEYCIRFEAERMSEVARVLKRNQTKFVSSDFKQQCEWLVQAKKRNAGDFENAIKNLYDVELQFIKSS